MPDTPVKVVIDCSIPDREATIAYTRDQVDAVLTQRTTGEITSEQAAARLVELADLAASAAGIPDRTTIVPLTDDELAQLDTDQAHAAEQDDADTARAWHVLRMQRDRWLAQTDWVVNPQPPDAPKQLADDIAANKAAWATFRQTLRDLPANTPDPADPDWPTQPPAPKIRLT